MKTRKDIELKEEIEIEGINVKEISKEFIDFYFLDTKNATKIINLYRNQGLQRALEMIDKWWKSIDIIHDAIKDNNKVITPEEFEELKSLIIGERMTEEELKYERELEKGDY